MKLFQMCFLVCCFLKEVRRIETGQAEEMEAIAL